MNKKRVTLIIRDRVVMRNEVLKHSRRGDKLLGNRSPFKEKAYPENCFNYLG